MGTSTPSLMSRFHESFLQILVKYPLSLDRSCNLSECTVLNNTEARIAAARLNTSYEEWIEDFIISYPNLRRAEAISLAEQYLIELATLNASDSIACFYKASNLYFENLCPRLKRRLWKIAHMVA